jgi:hypothetical protein
LECVHGLFSSHFFLYLFMVQRLIPKKTLRLSLSVLCNCSFLWFTLRLFETYRTVIFAKCQWYSMPRCLKFSQACATDFSHVGELKNESLEHAWKNFNICESETRAFVHCPLGRGPPGEVGHGCSLNSKPNASPKQTSVCKGSVYGRFWRLNFDKSKN